MIIEMIAPPQVAVIDLDGVTYPFNAEYKKACLAALARSTRFAVADRFNGKIHDAENYISGHGLHAPSIPRGLDRLVGHARRSLTTDFIKPAPLLAQHIKHLRRPTFVLSNSDPLWIDAVLEKRGLADVIPPNRRLSAPLDLGHRKRHQQAYRELAAKLQIKDPARILMVDDEPENLQAAHKAGLATALAGTLSKTQQNNLAATGYINIIAPDLKTLLNLLFPLPTPQPGAKP